MNFKEVFLIYILFIGSNALLQAQHTEYIPGRSLDDFPLVLKVGQTSGVLLSDEGLFVCPLEGLRNFASDPIRDGKEFSNLIFSTLNTSNPTTLTPSELRPFSRHESDSMPVQARESLRAFELQGSHFFSAQFMPVRAAHFLGSLNVNPKGSNDTLVLAFLRISKEDLEQCCLDKPVATIPGSPSNNKPEGSWWLKGFPLPYPAISPYGALLMEQKITHSEQGLLRELLGAAPIANIGPEKKRQLEAAIAGITIKQQTLNYQIASRKEEEADLRTSLLSDGLPNYPDSLSSKYQNFEPWYASQRTYRLLARHSEVMGLASTLRLFLQLQSSSQAAALSRKQNLLEYLGEYATRPADPESFGILLEAYVSGLPSRLIPSRLKDEIALSGKSYKLMARKWFQASILAHPDELYVMLENDFPEGLEKVSNDFFYRLLDELAQVQSDSIDPTVTDLQSQLKPFQNAYLQAMGYFQPGTLRSTPAGRVFGLINVQTPTDRTGVFDLPVYGLPGLEGAALCDDKGLLKGIVVSPSPEKTGNCPVEPCSMRAISIDTILHLLSQTEWGKDLPAETDLR